MDQMMDTRTHLEIKSHFLDDLPQVVSIQFNRQLILHTFKMVEKRPKVYPSATGFQCMRNHFEIMNHIMRCVNEETCRDDVPFS